MCQVNKRRGREKHYQNIERNESKSNMYMYTMIARNKLRYDNRYSMYNAIQQARKIDVHIDERDISKQKQIEMQQRTPQKTRTKHGDNKRREIDREDVQRSPYTK